MAHRPAARPSDLADRRALACGGDGRSRPGPALGRAAGSADGGRPGRDAGRGVLLLPYRGPGDQRRRGGRAGLRAARRGRAPRRPAGPLHPRRDLRLDQPRGAERPRSPPAEPGGVRGLVLHGLSLVRGLADQRGRAGGHDPGGLPGHGGDGRHPQPVPRGAHRARGGRPGGGRGGGHRRHDGHGPGAAAGGRPPRRDRRAAPPGRALLPERGRAARPLGRPRRGRLGPRLRTAPGERRPGRRGALDAGPGSSR